MNYAKALRKVIKEAEGTTQHNYTRAELVALIASITAQLREPMKDAERIMLVGDRARARAALARTDAPS